MKERIITAIVCALTRRRPRDQVHPKSYFCQSRTRAARLVSRFRFGQQQMMTRMHWILTCGIAVAGLLWFGACSRNDDFLTGEGIALEFSADTLRFDTVFTELGSATRFITVRNPLNRPVKVSRIFLEEEGNSPFRLNINGVPGNDQKDVTIFAEDSIYLFVEVTIDPDQPLSVSPFVINEHIVFQNGEEQQRVTLEAWGQNANYFPSRFNKGVPVVLTCDGGEIVWDDPKPYVIYGEVFIDSCLLTIPAGTQVYVHGGIARNELFGTFNDGILYPINQGRLHVRGTLEEPVIIQGDRLEAPFQEVSGQWLGIVFGPGSTGNLIEHATIRNSIFGVYVDSSAELSLRNTRIANTSSNGIIGIHSRITAENVLLYNNEATAINLVHGGDYDFTHCTLASYGVNAGALGLTNFICYDDPLVCNERSVYRLNATFTNSIISSSRRDAIQLFDISGGEEPGLFNIRFDHCLVRVEELLEQQDGLYADFFDNQCIPCISVDFDDPLFVDVNEDDYRLDTLSIAIETGKPTAVTTDLVGNPRDPDRPDAGSLEYVVE